jgi:hypothetical protein
MNTLYLLTKNSLITTVCFLNAVFCMEDDSNGSKSLYGSVLHCHTWQLCRLVMGFQSIRSSVPTDMYRHACVPREGFVRTGKPSWRAGRCTSKPARIVPRGMLGPEKIGFSGVLNVSATSRWSSVFPLSGQEDFASHPRAKKPVLALFSKVKSLFSLSVTILIWNGLAIVRYVIRYKFYLNMHK